MAGRKGLQHNTGNAFAGRKTIFTKCSSVKRGTARIGKHGPKIRSQMFQFSWELFLEMEKKETKQQPKLNIKKNTSFQNLFNYSEFSERQEDRGNTGLMIRRPGFIFSSARSPVSLGNAA